MPSLQQNRASVQNPWKWSWSIGIRTPQKCKHKIARLLSFSRTF